MGKPPEAKELVGVYLSKPIVRRLRGEVKDQRGIPISNYVDSVLAAHLFVSPPLEEWLEETHISLVIAPTLTEVLADDQLEIWKRAVRGGLIARFVFLNPSSLAYIHSLGGHVFYLDGAGGFGEEELMKSIQETARITRGLQDWSRPNDIRGIVGCATIDFIPFNLISRWDGVKDRIRVGPPSMRSPFKNGIMLPLSEYDKNFDYFRRISGLIQGNSIPI